MDTVCIPHVIYFSQFFMILCQLNTDDTVNYFFCFKVKFNIIHKRYLETSEPK